MKKFLIFALSALLMLSFAGCAKRSDKIIVGYDNHFAPMGFSQDGQDVGFDLDIAKAVGEELGLEFEFQAINWKQKEFELKAKSIDLIWNGYTITEDRKEQVAFSDPYLKNEQVVVIRKSDKDTYTSAESLVGKKLIWQNGSSAKDAVAGYADADGNKIFADTLSEENYTQLDDNVMILQDLNMANEHAAAVMDSVVANYYLSISEDFKANLMVIPDLVLAEEEYGIGLRKEDTELLAKINGALKTLKANGKLDEIAEKWGLSDLLLIEA